MTLARPPATAAAGSSGSGNTGWAPGVGRRALLHAAWSLPWGLATGLRAAGAIADHASVIASSPLRQAGIVATAILVHALLLAVASLLAGACEAPGVP